MVKLLLEKGAPTRRPRTKMAGPRRSWPWSSTIPIPIVFALLDPAAAAEKGKQLRRAFLKAKLAHVRRHHSPHASAKGQGAGLQVVRPLFRGARGQEGAREDGRGRVRLRPQRRQRLPDVGRLGGGQRGIWLQNWREIGLKRAREAAAA